MQMKPVPSNINISGRISLFARLLVQQSLRDRFPQADGKQLDKLPTPTEMSFLGEGTKWRSDVGDPCFDDFLTSV